MNQMDGYRIQKADPFEIPLLHKLIMQVWEEMENKDLFVVENTTEEWLRTYLDGRGFGVTARNQDGELAGLLIVCFPGEDEDNLGRDIGIPETELAKVVHMDTSVVAANHRGHGLEQRMLEYAEICLTGSGYRYLMATVSPDNPASLHSLEKAGYHVVLTKEKYGGYLRHILLKIIQPYS